MCVVVIVFFFFFFQAEDGIRDLTVTGVQTCALPICTGSRRRAARRRCPTDPRPCPCLRSGCPDRPPLKKPRQRYQQARSCSWAALHRWRLVYGKERDRKSTRLNSSHSQISYAVFCLKK